MQARSTKSSDPIRLLDIEMPTLLRSFLSIENCLTRNQFFYAEAQLMNDFTYHIIAPLHHIKARLSLTAFQTHELGNM